LRVPKEGCNQRPDLLLDTLEDLDVIRVERLLSTVVSAKCRETPFLCMLQPPFNLEALLCFSDVGMP